MAFLEINPKHEACLRRLGLGAAEDFLRLPSVVISGHPDRHVAQVTLGQGPDAVAAFLKREHRVSWKDRLANACAGFGFVSKSVREGLLLQLLARAGVGCPEWLAFGEDDRGRAFVLVRELAGCLDLRVLLRQRQAAPPRERYRLARRLGEALARLHDAGFAHTDLYAKHVLVEPQTEAVHVLDWQRSCYRVRIGWRRRRRDLAALHASLAGELARPRERLACLLAYLRAGGGREGVRGRVRSIRALAQRLLRRRHVREQHQPPLRTGAQNLIWLDGEALCVTREFWSRCGEDRAAVLAACGLASSRGEKMLSRKRLTSANVMLPDDGSGMLTRRRAFRPFAWLQRQRPASPELRQAGLLFRLQRYGVPTARLLAVGQRQTGAGWLESFLLVEPPPDAVPLAGWLAEHDDRQHLLDEARILLRRLHEAGCHFAPGDLPLLVQARPGQTARLVLGSVERIRTCRRRDANRERQEHALLERAFDRAAEPARASLVGPES